LTVADRIEATDSRARLIQQLADGQVHSGETLGAALGMSRAGVWKVIRRLEALGVEVEQQAGRGYWLAEPLELTDAAQIRAALGKSGDRHLELTSCLSCDSTNTQLMNQALPATPKFAALIADHQTGGRGRQGRTWRSALGQGIYLSLGQRQPGGLGRISAMSLVAGVACCRALGDLGIEGVGLKWPNDLWSDDHKLGGLLVEADGEVGGDCQWVVGVGINWRLRDVKDLDQPFTDLETLSQGAPPGRNLLCAALLTHLMACADELVSEGPGALLAAWRALDVLKDRPIRVMHDGTEVTGICGGIDDTGALQMEAAGRQLTVASGDVSLRPL
jgi:BirA family biotin operon repressor/biotin-[acetyl-CoA-carboxylase] ligase